MTEACWSLKACIVTGGVESKKILKSLLGKLSVFVEFVELNDMAFLHYRPDVIHPVWRSEQGTALQIGDHAGATNPRNHKPCRFKPLAIASHQLEDLAPGQ